MIRVEGRFTAGGVPDLLREIGEAHGPVKLDLSDLLSADSDGADALRGIAGHGIKVEGASPYIRQLLDPS